MRSLGVLALLCTSAGALASSRWELVALPPSGDVVWIDNDTIKVAPEAKTVFWAKTVFASPQASQAAPGKSYTYSLVRWEADCKRDNMRVLAASFYTANDEVVSNSLRPSNTTAPVFPDSIGDVMFKFVCHR